MSRQNGSLLSRRTFMQWAAAGAAWSLTGVSHATSTYPNKPVRIIVPFAAGGAVDLLARTVGQELGSRLGVPVIVENRPGAGTIIGTDAAAKAPADGYTLLMAVSTHVTNPYLHDKLPFNPEKDFAPVCVLAKPPIVLYANASLGLRNLEDLFQHQKQQKTSLNYGTGGAGTLSHLGAEEFSARSGLPLQHIVYKGGTPALNDTMAGHIPLFFGTVTIGQGAWKSGKVVALGIMSETRQPAMPDVSTFKEQGWDIAVSDWYGLLAPRGVPADIIAQLNRLLDEIVAQRSFSDRLTGIAVAKSTPDQMQAMLLSESARWGELVKKLGLKDGS